MISRRVERLDPINVGPVTAVPMLRRRRVSVSLGSFGLEAMKATPIGFDVQREDGGSETVRVGKSVPPALLGVIGLLLLALLTRRKQG